MATYGKKRYLILNADDFGQSHGVNRGIIEAHERGIVTSASLMVRWPAAAEAAAYAREHPDLSLGLHLDFGEWTCRRRGSWKSLYEVVSIDDAVGMAREAAGQLAAFQRLMRRDPTHLDSHQHSHRRPEVAHIFIQLAARLNVPLRAYTPEIRYCGSFYGQTGEGRSWPSLVSVSALIQELRKLPPGYTELSCHPGYARDLRSMYRSERFREIRTLCAPAIREAIAEMGITLCSFRYVRLAHNGGQG
jgi:chitin disaccharide deacetylase